MEALAKMTLLPAQRLETMAPVFRGKGRIRVGADEILTPPVAARLWLERNTDGPCALFVPEATRVASKEPPNTSQPEMSVSKPLK